MIFDSDFKGVQNNTAAHKIQRGFYQTDQGGDRSFQGVWRRRRGLLRSDLARITTAAPDSLLGFEETGEDFCMLISGGAYIYGFTNVGEQTF